jgi:3-hydroxyacyl-CoA dehydrogenase
MTSQEMKSTMASIRPASRLADLKGASLMIEAVFVLSEGIASREDIDTFMKLGANHPIGPLELADLIGLDTCPHVKEALHSGLGADK